MRERCRPVTRDMQLLKHISLQAGGVGLSIILACAATFAQKRGKGVTGTEPTTPETSSKGPKRGKGVRRPIESVPTVASTTIIKEVRPNEGALALLATPDAEVALRPMRSGKAGKTLKYKITQANGALTLTAMTPGAYQLNISHPDYESFSITVNIERGKPTTVAPELTSKYGAVVIGDLPVGVGIWLDEKPVERAAVDEQGRLSLERLPVGEHRLRSSKPGYKDWETKLTVKPGETLPLSAKMPLATVDMTVKTKPGARVYLNGEEKGIALPDGSLTVSNLAPGKYRLRALLDGYEPVEKALSLAPNNDRVVETVTLTPIAESSEATENFRQGLAKWSPAPPAWKVENGALHISGESVALFKDATETRAFNVYRDFTWSFDLSFGNRKGAAWVVRALDTKNYYLFELTTAKSDRRQWLLNFYLCRDGKLELKDSRDVVEKLETPGDSFQLKVKVVGNQFNHTINIASRPQLSELPLGSFTDNTFAYGGVGFQAINGMEIIVLSFVIIPEKKAE
jgi:PEGA domain